MLALAWALSINRRRINWRLVGIGLALQVVFGVLALKTVPGQAFFAGTDAVFTRLLGFTEEGARFIFGNLVRNNVPVGTPAGPPLDMAPIAAPASWAATGPTSRSPSCPRSSSSPR
jgi:nucleoside permease NupC